MSLNQPYNLQNLWEKTNYGLDYFHEVFPDSVGKENKNKHFKTHQEKTPSSTLSNQPDGIYRIYNHATKESMNIIDHVMKERSCNFIEACEFLFAKYGLSKESKIFYSSKKTWENNTSHDFGYYKLNISKQHHDYTEFAPFLTDNICREYNFVSLSGYEVVRKVHNEKTSLLKVESTEYYPIYAYRFENFSKIYEPKAQKDEKGFSTKHHFLGKKPNNFIYGWDRLINKVEAAKRDLAEKLNRESDEKKIAILKEQIKEFKLPCVIIATGGSDGLNIASLGYDVIWFNSEAEIISYPDYQELTKLAKVIYYCPDLDKTGIEQMVAMGMRYLDIKMIQLPAWLKESGKKDAADWIRSLRNQTLEKVKTKFEKLLSQALEFKFWSWHEKTGSYKYVYDSLLFFLQHQGFYVYKLKHFNNVKGYNDSIFIKIDKNVVREVSASDIKTFVINWLRENNISRGVLNMVIPSQFLTEKSLMTLPTIDIDFTDYTATSQYFFFKNKTVLVTKKGISYLDRNKTEVMCWEDAIIQKNIYSGDQQFKIYKDNNGNWDIEILRKDSHFLNYLINTSRIYWQKELESIKDKYAREKYLNENRFNIAGKNLSEDEIFEQKQHLINKIFSIGYLLHRYKNNSKPWVVYVMDNKIPENTSESHGGSGKSFLITSLLNILIKRKYIKGRDPEVTKNQFIYDGVTEETKLIFIDDAHYYLNLNYFFSELTGSLNVNPKFGKPFEIPFEHSPKFAITTNFAPKELDPSTLRRMLFVVFSDYYHEKSDEYEDKRQIVDDFGGRELFKSDFTEKEWCDFFNFCFQALQFYLGTSEKISAPEENVKKRNLLHQMGDSFYDFAKSYFNEEKLNVWIPRKEIQEAYKSHLSNKNLQSAAKQKESLEAFCQFNGWKLEITKGRLKSEEYTRLGISFNSVVEKFLINTKGTAIPLDEEPEAGPTDEQQHFIDFDDDDNDKLEI